METYRIEYTGILNDKWLGGVIYTNKKEAQAFVRFEVTETNHFYSGKRASWKEIRVVKQG